MKQRRILVAVLSLVVVSIVGCCQIVWLPDMFEAEKRVVASLELTNGAKVLVKQWWNKGDFYSVELEHTDQVGNTRVVLIDGDSPKWWTCNLTLQKSNVVVAHYLTKMGTYNLDALNFTRQNGVVVSADTVGSGN